MSKRNREKKFEFLLELTNKPDHIDSCDHPTRLRLYMQYFNSETRIHKIDRVLVAEKDDGVGNELNVYIHLNEDLSPVD